MKIAETITNSTGFSIMASFAGGAAGVSGAGAAGMAGAGAGAAATGVATTLSAGAGAATGTMVVLSATGVGAATVLSATGAGAGAGATTGAGAGAGATAGAGVGATAGAGAATGAGATGAGVCAKAQTTDIAAKNEMCFTNITLSKKFNYKIEKFSLFAYLTVHSCLYRRYGYCINNIIYKRTARQIVNRFCKTLKHGTYAHGFCTALNGFVGCVARV